MCNCSSSPSYYYCLPNFGNTEILVSSTRINVRIGQLPWKLLHYCHLRKWLCCEKFFFKFAQFGYNIVGLQNALTFRHLCIFIYFFGLFWTSFYHSACTSVLSAAAAGYIKEGKTMHVFIHSEFAGGRLRSIQQRQYYLMFCHLLNSTIFRQYFHDFSGR